MEKASHKSITCKKLRVELFDYKILDYCMRLRRFHMMKIEVITTFFKIHSITFLSLFYIYLLYICISYIYIINIYICVCLFVWSLPKSKNRYQKRSKWEFFIYQSFSIYFRPLRLSSKRNGLGLDFHTEKTCLELNALANLDQILITIFFFSLVLLY